jgi:phosphocarrier protein
VTADAAGPLSRSVKIVNERGLHARAAARFVEMARKFQSEITVSRDGTAVSGLSIMGLMMFAAGRGSTIEIRAKGADAQAALAALVGLVEAGFHEH